MTETLFYIAISLLLSAFFSSIEISFVSADMLQLTVRQEQGDRLGRLLRTFYNQRDRFLTTTLIGNTISLVVYGVFFAKLLDPPLQQFLGEQSEILLLLLQTMLSTGVVLAIAEFTPKYLGLIFSHNLKLLLILIQIMDPIYRLLKPFTWVVLQTNKLLMKHVLGLQQTKEKHEVRLQDLSNFLRNAETKDNDEQTMEFENKIFENAIAFQRVRVRDCMIPRTDIVAIEQTASIQELRQLFLTTGHSKIIVYQGDIDNIRGYCHAIRMYEQPQQITDILTEIPITPTATLTIQLMRRLIAEHKTIALVTDEFGGTAGIITMEDIVETILGEIEDEHDKPEASVYQVSTNIFELHARYKVKDLREEYGWPIPEGDYDTLGGFIIETLGSVPKKLHIMETDAVKIEILEVRGARIGQVRVTLLEPDNTPPYED
ncbi:MAG: hemolysin family protein [Bernardetiaceae bacterium]